MNEVCQCQLVMSRRVLLSLYHKTGHAKAISKIDSIPHNKFTTASMKAYDERMNLVAVNGEGFLMNDHEIEALQNSQYPHHPCQSLSIHCSALELTNRVR
jgi:hypothetical protein